MAQYEARFSGDVITVAQALREDIEASAVSIRLVEQAETVVGGVRVVTMGFDQYFMRNGNRTALSVTLAGDGHTVWVAAIGHGGGSGALFNFSWGAEESMVDVVADSLRRRGWTNG